jgi:uncharacterized phage-associated protein
MEPSKLEAVLVRLCRGRSMSMTQAVKLPYFVDVVAQHALGRLIVGATYEAWDYGVVAKEAWIMLHHDIPPSLTVEIHPYYETGFSVRAAAGPSTLTAEEAEIVDFVAEKYLAQSAAALGKLTKDMNPHIPPDGWGTNQQASTDGEAYFRLSDEWMITKFNLEVHDLNDKTKWGEPITDPKEYVRRALS